MKNPEKSSTSSSSGSSGSAKLFDRNVANAQPLEAPNTVEEIGQEIDRPGFDLGGSSGDTHAGTGLGLGEDAFDTPGDRRLPGRQPDNKLTIPRWGGSEPDDMPIPAKKPSDVDPR